MRLHSTFQPSNTEKWDNKLFFISLLLMHFKQINISVLVISMSLSPLDISWDSSVRFSATFNAIWEDAVPIVTFFLDSRNRRPALELGYSGSLKCLCSHFTGDGQKGQRYRGKGKRETSRPKSMISAAIALLKIIYQFQSRCPVNANIDFI